MGALSCSVRCWPNPPTTRAGRTACSSVRSSSCALDRAPLMEQAFAQDRVDLSVNGDWQEVQIELGLLNAHRCGTALGREHIARLKTWRAQRSL
ncbi:MAG: hypothetical protein R2851_15070 [Caldilineaceae bacterium]